MRSRDRIVGNLEDLFRREFKQAEEGKDRARMAELDFEFQRDQLYMEVLLDLRDLLTEPTSSDEPSSLLDKAEKLKKLKNLTRLRP